MPEGDTIHRAAATLQRALAGRIVTRFESVLPALTRVDVDTPIAGRTIEAVAARGKHLLMTFSPPPLAVTSSRTAARQSGGLILHTHMRMNGSWHIYRPGERWQRPARDMRLLVATDAFVAVGFNVPVAEFVAARDVRRRADLTSLGPDLLAETFDRADAVRRIRTRPADRIEDALLDQRLVAGIGNIFKSETLFACGVEPTRGVADLGDEELERIVETARTLLTASATGGRPGWSRGRFVYGRAGKPCRRCGTPIRARKAGPDARLTYWCPRCQSRPLR